MNDTVNTRPRTAGDVTWHLLGAFEITGDKAYLQKAREFTTIAVWGFVSSDSPLPKATLAHDRYEVITRGDTLMMALLALSSLDSPVKNLNLIYSDR